MILSKRGYQWLFGATIFILIAIIAILVSVIVQKNLYIKNVKEQINKNEALISEENERYNELKSQLEQSQQENATVRQQLEESEAAKKRLEDENNKLKKTIEQLKSQSGTQQVIKTPNYLGINDLPAGVPNSKLCYLTFDDGPSPVTLNVLETLKKYNVKATFFVVNSSTNTKYIGYLKNIYENGHTIGLHSQSHNYANIYSNADNFFNDLQAISETVKSYTGAETKVMRFPGGGSNAVSKKYCSGIMTYLVNEVQNRGYAYFDWNVDSKDASGNNIAYETIAENVFKQAMNKQTICVLMHDSSAKSTTAQALPYIIEGLTKMGFRFEALNTSSFGFHHGINN